MPVTSFSAGHAWLPDGFAANVAIRIDGGEVVGIAAGAKDKPSLGRYVLPGIANLHSHAFQRAMAGLAERQSNTDDSFWTWREVMYAFAGRIGPEDLQAIAAQLYVEMVKAGYTSVAEFHYLHHDRDGTPYADRVTMSEAIVAAAKEVGIGLTLLPVLYQSGGFGG